MTGPRIAGPAGERALSALMTLLFVASSGCLGVGLVWWIARPADAGALLTTGLVGLLAMPIVKLVTVIVTSAGDRDWLTLGATVAVLAILLALTLRDALTMVGWTG